MCPAAEETVDIPTAKALALMENRQRVKMSNVHPDILIRNRVVGVRTRSRIRVDRHEKGCGLIGLEDEDSSMYESPVATCLVQNVAITAIRSSRLETPTANRRLIGHHCSPGRARDDAASNTYLCTPVGVVVTNSSTPDSLLISTLTSHTKYILFSPLSQMLISL